MSGGASPTSQTMQTSNSTNTSSPNPYIQPDLQGLVDRLRGFDAANPTAPGYYPGGTVAAPSPAAQSARDTAWGWAANSLKNIGGQYAPSLGYLSDAASGKYLDAGNPYMAGKLEAMFRPQNEQFTNLVAPSLNATFAGAGRTGGGLHVDNMLERYKTDIAQTQSDAAAKAAADVYGMERGLQSSAATALPGVVGQQQGQVGNWLNIMQGVGAGDDALNQRYLNDTNARYDYDNRAQLDWLSNMANRYLGMYPGGQTQGNGTSSGFSTGSQGGGGFGSVAGPIMSGLGTLAMFAPMFSDERLKEDITPVGALNDGQTVYSYRYKGDPRTQIGLLAQEVERVHPEAVITHPSGFKMVDYRAAMPAGGLL